MIPSERGLQLLGWMISFTIICLLVLGLRHWAARVAKRKLYLDDAFVWIAFASVFALHGVNVWAIWHGLGAHIVELKHENIVVLIQLYVAAQTTWLVGTVSIKLSLLFLYARIFSIRTFKRWIWALMIITGLFGGIFMIVFFTRCIPVSYAWNPKQPGKCYRGLYLDELTSLVINIVLDIAIIVLPLPILWGLKMAVRTKLTVTFMFSLGLITIGIMLWRLHYTIATELNPTPDFSYDAMDMGLITLMELWLGIIVATAPTLGPLVKTYIKPAISKLSTSRRSKNNSSGPASGIQLSSGGGLKSDRNKLSSQVAKDSVWPEERPSSTNSDEYPLSYSRQGNLTDCTVNLDTKSASEHHQDGGIYVRRNITVA